MKVIFLCTLATALWLSACSGQPTTIHGTDVQAQDRSCVRSTGSRIRRDDGECLPVAGRSYGESELDRTGATDVGQALSAIDPSISVGR